MTVTTTTAATAGRRAPSPPSADPGSRRAGRSRRTTGRPTGPGPAVGHGLEDHCSDAILVEATPHGQRVTLRGRLDVHSVPDARLALHLLIDEGHGAFHLDLTEALIGDATGLGMLVETHRRARRRGRDTAIVAVTERTSRLLRASRLDRVMVVRPQLVSAPDADSGARATSARSGAREGRRAAYPPSAVAALTA